MKKSNNDNVVSIADARLLSQHLQSITQQLNMTSAALIDMNRWLQSIHQLLTLLGHAANLIDVEPTKDGTKLNISKKKKMNSRIIAPRG